MKIGALVAASLMVVRGYYVTGLKALAAARERSQANEKRDEWSCRLVMGLVEKLSAARGELVGSRWQVVAARFEAVSAKSDGGNFGGGQREVVEAQQVLVEVLKRTVAELRQECWLRAGGVEVMKWEGGDKMMQRIAKSRLRWAAGAELEGMSQQESEAEGERRVLEEYGYMRRLGEAGMRGVTRRPVEGIELAI